MAAAQRFFAQALDIVGRAPEQVTTDGHDAYPRAIREAQAHSGEPVPLAERRRRFGERWAEVTAELAAA